MPMWMPYDGYIGPLGTNLRPIQCVEKNAEEIASRHNDDIDALEAERDKWRNAVIDAAVVNWTYTAEDEENPYLAVCKLMACAARESLDPQISVEAKKRHDRIAELTADRDEWEKRCKRLVGVLSVYGLSPQAVAMIADGSMEADNDWRRTL
jgi:hypothetical protein